jgi:predicted phage terminase large subunit-like protein
MSWATEKGQIASGVGPYLDRRQRERRAYVYRQAFPTRGDKAVRAQSFRGYIAQHGLYVPQDAPWYPELRAEMLGFPAAKHDDMCDMLGLLGQLIDKMMPGTRPRAMAPVRYDRWDKAFDEEEPINWKVM